MRTKTLYHLLNVVIAFGGILCAYPTCADDVLTTANAIARFPETAVDTQPAVNLKAFVSFVDPVGTVFLQDETGATFLRASNEGKRMKPGQVLEIKGLRYPGLFVGGIIPKKIIILGETTLPEPQKVTWEDLASGRHHYARVQMEGVGRSISITGENTATLRLNVDGKIVEVRFDQAPENTADYVDATLLVKGLAAGAINDRRQLVMPYLRVADSHSVSILTPTPSDPFSAPLVPMSSLSSTSLDKLTPHRVKVKGVALSGLMNGGFFIREENRSLFVQTQNVAPIQPGDEVEALGFIQMGTFSTMLADAVFQKNGRTNVPAAIKVTDRDLNNGTCDNELVSVVARITQQLDGEHAFLAEVGKFSLKVSAPTSFLPGFNAGSVVRLTGLCRVSATTHKDYRANPTAYELWLRLTDDAVLISAAPWWNATHLAVGLGIVGMIALLTFAWAASLRRQVLRQLTVIEAKAQREAITEERQRIAREFHDTLEQELAGLSLRLDAATPRVADDKARSLLEQLRKLLLRLQTETRDFVWDLRDSTRNEISLEKALSALIEHLQSTTSIELRFQCEDTIPKLLPLTQHHLLRITREAVHNAVKSAQPTMIEIILKGSPTRLQLAICDNGKGFDATQTNVVSGHFGIQGMKERALKIGTELKITSQPAQGTRIEIELDV